MSDAGKRGLLMVLSGPSGSGKSTVIHAMIRQYGIFLPPIHFSVSATTRPPRPDETEGEHYRFVAPDAFMTLRDNGGLLEWAEYAGNYYGTPTEPVCRYIEKGHVVLLDIEVKGALQVKQAYPDSLFVYLVPRSLSQLEARLRARGTESEAGIARRMQTVGEQIQHLDIYDQIVFNDTGRVDEAAFNLAAVIAARLSRGQINSHLIQA